MKNAMNHLRCSMLMALEHFPWVHLVWPINVAPQVLMTACVPKFTLEHAQITDVLSHKNLTKKQRQSSELQVFIIYQSVNTYLHVRRPINHDIIQYKLQNKTVDFGFGNNSNLLQVIIYPITILTCW